MQQLIIRRAAEADLAEIRACLVETWHATYDALYGVDEVNRITGSWHAIDVLRAQLAQPGDVFEVAEAGGIIAGTALAHAALNGVAKLGRLYVRPHHQGQGIGAALLASALSGIGPAERITLEVAPGNISAIRFYETHGFHRAAQAASCGGDPSLNSVIFEMIVQRP